MPWTSPNRRGDGHTSNSENFFLDPYGEIPPCNGMDEQYRYESMGNRHDVDDFMTIWNSPRADEVRAKVAKCPKCCWMIGSASPVMKKYMSKTLPWVIKNRLSRLAGKRICGDWCPHFDVGQDPEQGRLADVKQDDQLQGSHRRMT